MDLEQLRAQRAELVRKEETLHAILQLSAQEDRIKMQMDADKKEIQTLAKRIKDRERQLEEILENKRRLIHQEFPQEKTSREEMEKQLTLIEIAKDPLGRHVVVTPLAPYLHDKLLKVKKEVGMNVPLYMFPSDLFGDRKELARRIFERTPNGDVNHRAALALFYNKNQNVGFITGHHLQRFFDL